MDNAKHKQDLNSARENFKQRRFFNMPLAGLFAWSCIGIGGVALESPQAKAWLLFIATGSIVYIAMLFSKVTGEFFFKNKKILLTACFFTAY